MDSSQPSHNFKNASKDNPQRKRLRTVLAGTAAGAVATLGLSFIAGRTSGICEKSEKLLVDMILPSLEAVSENIEPVNKVDLHLNKLEASGVVLIYCGGNHEHSPESFAKAFLTANKLSWDCYCVCSNPLLHAMMNDSRNSQHENLIHRFEATKTMEVAWELMQAHAKIVFKTLFSMPEIAKKKIVIFGQSLGGCMAAMLTKMFVYNDTKVAVYYGLNTFSSLWDVILGHNLNLATLGYAGALIGSACSKRDLFFSTLNELKYAKERDNKLYVCCACSSLDNIIGKSLALGDLVVPCAASYRLRKWVDQQIKSRCRSTILQSGTWPNIHNVIPKNNLTLIGERMMQCLKLYYRHYPQPSL